MRVYRLEVPTLNGRWEGPYRTMGYASFSVNKISARMSTAHCDFDDHPTLSARGLRGGEVRYGCPSMPALFRWFGGWLPAMMRLGARVVTVEVPESDIVNTDGKQVIYRASAAREV